MKTSQKFMIICKILYRNYKQYLSAAVKPIVFVFILLFLIVSLGKALAVPKVAANERTGINDIHKYPNSYDVCFVGRSTVMANVSCQELYEEYGIAGVCAGVSAQRLPLTLYTLEEVLEYQSPQVVFLDTRAIFGSDLLERSTFEDEPYLHATLDTIKTLSIKKQALEKAQIYNKDIDVWDYYSTLYYSHENWKNLAEQNFTNYDSDATDNMHGNVIYLDIGDSITNTYNNSKRTNAAVITKKEENYVTEMIDLCNDAGADLVFVTTYTHFLKDQHDAIAALARKHHIKYLDMNEYILKTEFQHELDLIDISHFNLSGAIKATDFLGEFLQNNYEFTDKRKDKSYHRYEEQKKLFAAQKDFIYSKQSLLSAISFNKYLAELNKINTDENIIFISVSDDAFSHLTKLEMESLRKLGVSANLTDKRGASYLAVISNENIQEEFSFLNSVSAEGKIGKLSYEITSGGSESGTASSIMIDGQKAIQTGKGFNFVVYNTSLDKIMSACFFDTSEYVNPAQSRNKTTISTSTQREIGPNIWEDIQ